MTEFQAVDLDAVLDQFECHEDEFEKEKTTHQTDDEIEKIDRESSSTMTGQTEFHNSSNDSDNKLLSLNEALNELRIFLPSEDVASKTDAAVASALESHEETKNESRVDLHNDAPEFSDEDFNTEARLSGDVASKSLTELVENWDHNETLPHCSQQSPSPESTGSNVEEFESIYDQSSRIDESAEQQNSEHEDEATVESQATSAKFDPTESLLAFKAEEMTDEELNLLLEHLENNENQNEETDERSKKVVSEMGARPKDTQREVNSSHDSESDYSNSNRMKDLVTPRSSSDSPPPYSELDPVKSAQLSRPTTLEITNESVDSETPGSNEVQDVDLNSSIVVGPPGSTPANPSGPDNHQVSNLLQGLSEDQLILGKIQPFWIPDSEAASCMICGLKFTLVKRRHHCRACGKVLCSLCCSEKFSLQYMNNREDRVCKPCKGILERLSKAENLGAAEAPSSSRPDPLNPMEYCSRVPPQMQAEATSLPPVMVPVGVLKRFDSTPTSDPKQVIFSDGIRPGGDLTELDEDARTPTRRSHRSSNKKRQLRGPAGASDVARSMIPPDHLPYVSGRGPVDEDELQQMFGANARPVAFTLNRNLRVYVSLVMYGPISKNVWNFRTQGLTSVGQDEVVILLVQLPDEPLPPRDVFEHLQSLYENAGKGAQVSDMGHSVILSGKPFLDGTQYGGFLYFRHSFQCIDDLDIPPPPFLFAVLLTKWEMPWARVFPLRLLLRLGAEARYYPAPLWSTRQRQTVFKEIGNTIMKLLSDFRNFSYTLPIIRALVIHMEDKVTTVLIPKSSYSQIQRALQNSNDPVLALGANFSITADSHLVAVQRDEDEPPRNPMNTSDYETQAINILNKPRKVTGASFVVLNGALKSSSGLTAKCSIVEDGIMIQVTQDRMLQVRKSLNNMQDVRIDCGHIGAEKPDETVFIKWVEKNQTINAGIKSIIDGTPMDGITSVRIKGTSQEFIFGDYCIRWTELFLLPTPTSANAAEYADPPDPAKVASHISKSICLALMPQLQKLKDNDLTPLAVRVHLDAENAGYEAGSHGQPLPQEFMNSLDDQLVPVVHGQSMSRASFELLFHILDV